MQPHKYKEYSSVLVTTSGLIKVVGGLLNLIADGFRAYYTFLVIRQLPYVNG